MLRTGFLSLCLLTAVHAAPVSADVLDSRLLDAVPLHVLALDDLERARAALPAQGSRGPMLMAVPVPMPLGLDDGAWTQDGDTSIWRTRLYSAGATLLIAAFDRFELPPGATFTVSDVRATLTQGPYTAANHTPDGHFWTAMVPGEEALIELRLPTSERSAVDLHMAQLGHGVMPLAGSGGVQAKSGSCNVDAVCETDAGWRDQIRSVVLLQIANTVCTGNLVNTTAQDDRPYILTATHCGVTAGNASQITAYFNYQTSSCGRTPNGSLGQNVTGASLLFQDSRSDHTLIRLNRAPPLSYGAYFAGFEASSSAIPQNGRGIHHPSGDEKRISTYSSRATKTPVALVGGSTIDAFSVTWSTGVTEPGSSGSGLWNENKRMVGVLSGGAATCGGLLGAGASAGPDYYGRLEVAWRDGLGDYLNPSDNGATTVAGKNQTSTSGGGTTTGGGSGGSTSSGGGGGGGSFGAGLVLLALGLMRLALRGSKRAT